MDVLKSSDFRQRVRRQLLTGCGTLCYISLAHKVTSKRQECRARFNFGNTSRSMSGSSLSWRTRSISCFSRVKIAEHLFKEPTLGVNLIMQLWFSSFNLIQTMCSSLRRQAVKISPLGATSRSKRKQDNSTHRLPSGTSIGKDQMIRLTYSSGFSTRFKTASTSQISGMCFRDSGQWKPWLSDKQLVEHWLRTGLCKKVVAFSAASSSSKPSKQSGYFSLTKPAQTGYRVT